MVCSRKHLMCSWGNYILLLLGRMFCKCLLGPFGLQCFSNLLFPYWFLGLGDLTIIESTVLTSPTIVVLPFISPFSSVSFCFQYLSAPNLQLFYLLDRWFLYHYIVTFFFFLPFLKSILTDISMATSAFLCLPFGWNVFFHPFSLSLCVPLRLKWISYRLHRAGAGSYSYFFNPYILCLFIYISSN